MDEQTKKLKDGDMELKWFSGFVHSIVVSPLMFIALPFNVAL